MAEELPKWRPSVEEVAEAIRARTYTDADEGEPEEPLDDVVGGQLAGTFDEHTQPTAEQVEGHITNACNTILGHFASGVVPEASEASAKSAAALKAALAVELASFDSTASTSSPYLQLRIDADAALSSLLNTAQVRDLFGERPAEPAESE